MPLGFRSIVVVPCFNEAGSIAGLVKGIKHHVRDVIVVDDGSSDDTARLAKGAGADIISHETRKGKGAALGSGLREALARGFDWAIVMDGDGQHDPSDIPVFLRTAEECDGALIVGNRMGQAHAIPAVRRIVNRWMSRRISRLTGGELPDSQCGFRMVNLSVWSQLTMAATHFEVESEWLVRFSEFGYPIRFVPVATIYHGGGSKIRPVRDTWRWLRWWGAEWLRKNILRSRRRPGANGAGAIISRAKKWS